MKLEQMISQLSDLVQRFPQMAKFEVTAQHSSFRGWIPIQDMSVVLGARRVELLTLMGTPQSQVRPASETREEDGDWIERGGHQGSEPKTPIKRPTSKPAASEDAPKLRRMTIRIHSDRSFGMTAHALTVEDDGETADVDAMRDALDPGIRRAVEVLRAAGVETFESCEGGDGHAYPEPTVRFHGHREAGLRALAAALEVDLPVLALRRTWLVIDGEPTGPWWELTFTPTAGQQED